MGAAVRGFYWLIDGALAGSGRPGGWRRGGAADDPALLKALDDDLTALRGHGIEAVLTLTETPLVEGALERHDLAGLHIPIDDLQAPTPDQFRDALAFIDRQRARGRKVVVHCLVGQGRTGSILAAYLIRGGLDAPTALRQLRAVCPGAVENRDQEQALAEFAARRDWLV
jgi:atypical dual specificity phosphatase